MRLERVHPNFAAAKWPLAERHFAKVTPHVNGDWTDDQFKADVLTGRIRMVLAMSEDECIGAAGYTLHNNRNARTAFIVSMAGDAFITSADSWRQLVDMFRQEGATRVEAAMRPSMARLCGGLGFKSKYTVVEVEL